ncbi:MAG: CapA family protein [Haloferacaceae archaeon]
MSKQQRESFTLAATGDSIITRELLPYEGVAPEFDGLLDVLRDADATVTNLEVLLHDYEGHPAAASGGTYMRAPPSMADQLEGMGCDLFSAATNHAYDYSHGGLEATIRALETRGLTYAGVGQNLYEARSPSYLETPAGRVALLSACSTITPGSEAGRQSETLEGRPGLNPLHVERVYRLPERQLDDLRELSETLGIERIKREWRERGLHIDHDWHDDGYFHFMDMKFEPCADEGSAGIEYRVRERDEREILEYVTAADRNADWVVVSMHTHEGTDGRSGTQSTPSAFREFAHDCIDAGADAFVGTGPHVLRGVELYDGKPVFHSLGNFIVQNKSVDRLPPQSFRRYGLTDHTKVADLFDARLRDEDGSPKGDLARDEFWETVVPVCTFSNDGDGLEVELYPCTLQQGEPRSQRGIPVLATGSKAERVLEDVAALSEPFDTEVRPDGDRATVHPRG